MIYQWLSDFSKLRGGPLLVASIADYEAKEQLETSRTETNRGEDLRK